MKTRPKKTDLDPVYKTRLLFFLSPTGLIRDTVALKI